jgi:hypothetical protein
MQEVRITRLVAGRIAIVGARERRDTESVCTERPRQYQLLLHVEIRAYRRLTVLDRIPVLPDLVTTNDSRHLIRLAPPLGHIRSEPNPDPTFTRPSPRCVLRIRPQELAHESLLPGLFPVPVDLFHVIQRDAVLGEQTAVDDKVSFLAVWREDGGLRSFGFGRRGRLRGR